MDNIWQLQDAKSKFSEVVNCALSQGVQIVTKHGKKAVVVMSFTEYEKMIVASQKALAINAHAANDHLFFMLM